VLERSGLSYSDAVTPCVSGVSGQRSRPASFVTGADADQVSAVVLTAQICSAAGVMSEPGIERPICKRCGVRTMLVRISPDGLGFEVRSFECPECNHVVIERVATDPLEQAKGWLLAGELRPPV
jgi:hypothetical protein